MWDSGQEIMIKYNGLTAKGEYNMKSLILIISLVAGVLFAQTFTKISSANGCSIRDIGTMIDSKIVGKLGITEKSIISIRADWHKVEVMSGSDNVGKIGYVYYKMLDGTKVIGEGCVVRSKGSMSGERIFSLKAGAVVKILESAPSWVQIAEGWVYAPACQLK